MYEDPSRYSKRPGLWYELAVCLLRNRHVSKLAVQISGNNFDVIMFYLSKRDNLGIIIRDY